MNNETGWFESVLISFPLASPWWRWLMTGEIPRRQAAENGPKSKDYEPWAHWTVESWWFFEYGKCKINAKNSYVTVCPRWSVLLQPSHSGLLDLYHSKLWDSETWPNFTSISYVIKINLSQKLVMEVFFFSLSLCNLLRNAAEFFQSS